jgi:hypothetical protein
VPVRAALRRVPARLRCRVRVLVVLVLVLVLVLVPAQGRAQGAHPLACRARGATMLPIIPMMRPVCRRCR